MTNTELDRKIAEAMIILRRDNVQAAIKDAWKGYFEELKKEAKKVKRKKETITQAADRLSESDPCDMYCYVMFDDEGDLVGWTIDGSQYWQGHSGPSSAIGISSGVTYEEIEREIGNDLAEALEIDDGDESPETVILSTLSHNDKLEQVYYKGRLVAAKLGKNWGNLTSSLGSGPASEPAIIEAVNQAIFSVPKNTSAGDLRHRIGEYLTAH